MEDIGLDIEDRIDDRQERDIWTRSEAVLKSCALGIGWLESVEMESDSYAALSFHGQQFQRRLYEVSPWPGMSAYLAVAPSDDLVIAHVDGDLYDSDGHYGV
ncbi:hypothetical protein E3T28_08320 [Cryobacterium sinapicolor]|uniref:Uncharacterized protein n=1 Tax=Cryobacterium sinapicolor TaxID=1259236 RepID=A0ABY2J8W4_9MICO|nr:hypothetical protein [Cryobacterium sinapicolor]TFD00127.1 hypothetical protein E3T28_08320 [Cryobacterium sinapicolor]